MARVFVQKARKNRQSEHIYKEQVQNIINVLKQQLLVTQPILFNIINLQEQQLKSGVKISNTTSNTS